MFRPQEFLDPDDDKFKSRTDDKIIRMISEARLPALKLWTFAILKHHPAVIDEFIKEIKNEFANPANNVNKKDEERYWALTVKQIEQTSKEHKYDESACEKIKGCLTGSTKEEKNAPPRPRSNSSPT